MFTKRERFTHARVKSCCNRQKYSKRFFSKGREHRGKRGEMLIIRMLSLSHIVFNTFIWVLEPRYCVVKVKAYLYVVVIPILSLFLTHYQTTNFRLFETERVCRRQFQISRKWQKCIQMGRKHCGKRRNCSLRAISPFPKVFSKGLFPRGVKRCHCVEMG